MTKLTGTVMDMHVHTINGVSSDSALDPEHLAEEAERIGMTGVNISEHDSLWDRSVLERYREAHADLFVSNGMEVSTNLGHIIIIGVTHYVAQMRRCDELRRIVSDQGGFMVLAHPFRYYFDPPHFRQNGFMPDLTPRQAAEQSVFRLVDDIEVTNSCNTPRENWFALQVARALGTPGFGGSDAHSRSGIGSSGIALEKRLSGVAELLAELHARRYQPVRGINLGEPRPFVDLARDFEQTLATLGFWTKDLIPQQA